MPLIIKKEKCIKGNDDKEIGQCKLHNIASCEELNVTYMQKQKHMMEDK